MSLQPVVEASFPVTAYAQVDGAGPERTRVPVAESNRLYSVAWTAAPASLSTGSTSLQLPQGRPVLIHLGFWEGGDGTGGDSSYEYRCALQSKGRTELVVLAPGESWRRYVFPQHKIANSSEDLSGISSSDVTRT